MNEAVNESIRDLEKLAVNILGEYGITPQDIQIIQSGSIKTVWKIGTPDRVLCLKRLRQAYEQVLFSTNAQIYIKNSGGNVPEIILNKENQPVLKYGSQLFAVYEWLEGRDLNFKENADLELALKGLAAFHKVSKGYQHPENAKESSKLGKWPEQYNSMKNRLLDWKEIATASRWDAFHDLYLKYVDSMVEIADLALEQIDKSMYNELSVPDSDLKVLCHQDFGKGNAIYTSNGVIVLDLDSVTHDFSARDLRKIISKLAVEDDLLNENKMNDILTWYTMERPLNEEEKKILYIDLLFPHKFHGLVKNQYLNNKPIKLLDVEEVVQFEKAKLALLMNLIK